MERFSEVVIQNDNLTATRFSGVNVGKYTLIRTIRVMTIKQLK